MQQQRLEAGQQDPLHIFSEFEDETRQQLVAQIVKDQPALIKIPRQCLFALWFSDIETLRQRATPLKDDREQHQRFRLVGDVGALNVPEIWAGGAQNPFNRYPMVGVSTPPNKRRRADRSLSPLAENVGSPSQHLGHTDSPPVSTEKKEAKKADERKKAEQKATTQAGIRDKRQCVVTKYGQTLTESAHIFPKKLNGTPSNFSFGFSTWLSRFWDLEKVNRLEDLLQSSDGTLNMEQTYNRITLAVHVHRYWDRGVFALRPVWVNEDRTEMQIAFHWLPLKERIPELSAARLDDQVPIEKNPYQDIIECRPLHGPGENDKLFHVETEHRISSGYVFTVKTDNKELRPLPSFELLELRWHLSRIACMQGRGEEEDDDDFDSDFDGGAVSVRSGSRSRSRGRNEGSPKENLPFRPRVQSRSPSIARSVEFESPDIIFHLVE